MKVIVRCYTNEIFQEEQHDDYEVDLKIIRVTFDKENYKYDIYLGDERNGVHVKPCHANITVLSENPITLNNIHLLDKLQKLNMEQSIPLLFEK